MTKLTSSQKALLSRLAKGPALVPYGNDVGLSLMHMRLAVRRVAFGKMAITKAGLTALKEE